LSLFHELPIRLRPGPRIATLGLSIALLVFPCTPGLGADQKPSARTGPGLLVETAWLDENVILPELVVLDLRQRETFEQNHIPGSKWLDANGLITREGATASVIPVDAFKELMESLGVGDGSRVVAVDDVGGPQATRLWWTLGYYGFDSVSVLNGGFTKWEMEGRAVTVEMAPYLPMKVTFTPKPRPERSATAEQVKAWLSKPQAVVLDVRATPEYTGKRSRTKRGGHIPGARNLPWDACFTEQDGLRVFRSASELQEALKKSGISPGTSVVAYDHDGRRSTQILFTMALVGLSADGVDYTGGWVDWSNRSDFPVEATEKPAPQGTAGKGKASPPASSKASGKSGS
jgi:thiosulfate/3-mercaptopyruvate sulfurtransferase